MDVNSFFFLYKMQGENVCQKINSCFFGNDCKTELVAQSVRLFDTQQQLVCQALLPLTGLSLL